MGVGRESCSRAGARGSILLHMTRRVKILAMGAVGAHSLAWADGIARLLDAATLGDADVAGGQGSHANSSIGGARVLKRDDDVLVIRDEIAGERVVVKRWRMDFGARLKGLVKMSRAWRHWRGAGRLSRAGVRTAEPLVLALVDGDEVLVMRAIEGPTLLEVMAEIAGKANVNANGNVSVNVNVKQGGEHWGVAGQHDLARLVGELVARLAGGGFFNRDLKPSNVIVTRGHNGRPALAVIDCVAIRRSSERRCSEVYMNTLRMVSMLVIEPIGCGVLPRRSLRFRALIAALHEFTRSLPHAQASQARRTCWQSVAQIVEKHGDPTPRVNPLG